MLNGVASSDMSTARLPPVMVAVAVPQRLWGWGSTR